MYTIVIDTSANRDSLVYLIVRQGDIGHYVVARAYQLNDAKVICAALEAADKQLAPF